MHLAVLNEDKSGVPVIKVLIEQILGERVDFGKHSFSVHAHRGKGHVAKDIFARPKQYEGGLLNLLPAEVRAYAKAYHKQDVLIVPIMDSDTDDVKEVKAKLRRCIYQTDLTPYYVLGICVEEMEAWLLGDADALLHVYPDLDLALLRQYKQDSICGTWEYLIRVIEDSPKAERIIAQNYPVVGQYKARYAKLVAPYMHYRRNKSPSLQAFVTDLNHILDKYG